jgi:hypothetical protein
MPLNQPTHRQSQEKSATQQRTKKPEEPALGMNAPEALPASLIQKGRLAPHTLSSLDLRQLQGVIGNRSASDLVQLTTLSVLQRDDGEGGLLNPAQVARALGYYRARRAQYTPAIIRQIQSGLGIPETGIADETLAQTVATYQQAHSPLAVDGMAGPRTLPALFPSGLAEETATTRYTEAARRVIEGDWASMTDEERADAIIAEINIRLDAIGVPRLGRDIDTPLPPTTYGRLGFSIWAIRINRTLLASPTLTDEQAADLAGTIYHEARHAEQWFHMAQLLAGQGKTAAQIEAQMGIPARIAALAFASPIRPGSMEALIADGWFQSVYGTGSAHRERVLGPTGTDIEYRNLPEEADAYRVEAPVIEAYLAGPEAVAPEAVPETEATA